MTYMRNYKGQRYEIVDARVVVRRDGSETTLATWRTHCAVCDVEFEFEGSFQGPLNRRCQEHKNPGVRV